MKKALVLGGANGLGISIVKYLYNNNYEKIYVFDRKEPLLNFDTVQYVKFNLVSNDYSAIESIIDSIDTVVITAGIGRLCFFENIALPEIDFDFMINTLPTIKLTKYMYSRMKSNKDIIFIVLTSIAGHISSPLYSLYSATKAAQHKFIEAINSELKYHKSRNRILEVAPGYISGTNFHGNKTDVDGLESLTEEIFQQASNHATLFIPNYDEVYSDVIKKYNSNSSLFSDSSLEYKLSNNDLENKPKFKVGYMSGTFDLFHIGHLNMFKRAKEYCDYLIVGVHKDGQHKGVDVVIPFEERMEIVRSCKYVDKVILSHKEDSDVFEKLHYDYLFVGSDYKGTERFLRYEALLSPLGVEIVYFPYTKGTSSTKLREHIQKINSSS